MNQQGSRQWSTKHVFTFPLQESQMTIRSDFDNGNMLSAKQLCQNSYIITPSLDSYKKQVTSKTFFHFKVEDYPMEQITIRVQPLDVLAPLQKSGNLDNYKPWIRYEGEQEEYQKMIGEDVRVYGDDTLCLAIRFTPRKNNFYLAFAEPYTFTRYLKLINNIHKTDGVFVKKDLLCYSLEKRPVYILNITSKDLFEVEQGKKKYQSSIMFPEMQQDQKTIIVKKPVILITSRVHPGEPAASFAMEGIIQFLLSSDLRAYILRKLFHFLIVPMINVDGVHNGFYRSDTMGNNLNRFYNIADQNQPSIFSIKTLIEEFSSKQKLIFFFDLHGHPSYKGSFLYGNWIQDLSFQTQAYLFAKTMSLNCASFSLSACNFAKTQMNAKDRPSQPTKEGSGRVFSYRQANIPHSYTMEFGMHSIRDKDITEIQQVTNTNYCVSGCKYVHKPPQFLRKERTDYNKQILSSEGIAILISVLDLIELNPYSRVNKGLYTISELRKSSLKDVYQKSDRFRLLQKLNPAKILTIARTMEQSFTKYLNTRWLNSILTWPGCMKVKRNIRLNSCATNHTTSRPSQPMSYINYQMQTVQTEQYQADPKYAETARTSNNNSLRGGFQRFKDINSNTVSIQSSNMRKNLKQQFRQKMQYWINHESTNHTYNNSANTSKIHDSQQQSPSKIKIKYKKIFILEKEFLPQKKEGARMIEINFNELKLQPQEAKLPQASTKTIKRDSSKQQERSKSRVTSRNPYKLTSDVGVYQSIFMQKQKQKESARRTQQFKLASLLQPIEEIKQDVINDEKFRVQFVDRKDVKMERFSKSFKEKRRSNA